MKFLTNNIYSPTDKHSINDYLEELFLKMKIMIVVMVLLAITTLSAVSAGENQTVTSCDCEVSAEPVRLDDYSVNETSHEDVLQAYDGNETPLSSIDAKLEVVKVPEKYGETEVILKLTTRDTNAPLSNVQIGVSSCYEFKHIKTNSSGMATYTIPFVFGSHEISFGLSDEIGTIANWNDELYIKNTVDKVITISDVPATFTASFPSGKYLQVKVTDKRYGKALQGAKIKVRVYTGSKYKTVSLATNCNGIAKYSLAGLSVGTHKFVIMDDDPYLIVNTKTVSTKIAVPDLTLSAPKKRNIYRTGSFTITVKNKKMGNVMSGVLVTAKVYTGKKYKTFSVKTNSKGVASFSTKSLKKGTHKVVISIKKTSRYKAASAKSSVAIVTSKIRTSIEFSGKAYEYHYASSGLCDGVTIYPKLVAGGKTLNKKLTVKTPAGTYSGYGDKGIFLPNVFDSVGNAVFVPLTRGGSATVSFAQDNYYLASSKVINF